MKKIAVLTSGGDCSGMNAAIRAVVRAGLKSDLDVVGVHRGFSGLVENDCEALSTKSVSAILQRGGTFLQSSRCPAMHDKGGQEKALRTLGRHDIDGVVVIGGDGSLRGALALHELGVKVVGIPASIDNDIPSTDMSLGVDTALNNIIAAVDSLKDTASSHNRTFVVETMGRNCGYLAVAAAVACGAEFALIPEVEYDLALIIDELNKRHAEGRNNSLIIVAEGAATAADIAEQLKGCNGFETRIMVLGHYQRGGSPSTFDRLLAARFGVEAVNVLKSGESGRMLGLNCSKLESVKLEDVFSAGRKPIDATMLELLKPLGC